MEIFLQNNKTFSCDLWVCTDVPTILSPVPVSLVKLEVDWRWGSNVRSTIWGLLPVWRVTTAKLISRMTKLCSKCWKLLSEAQTGWRILGKSASSLWFYQVSEWYFNLLRYPSLEPQVILFFFFFHLFLLVGGYLLYNIPSCIRLG